MQNQLSNKIEAADYLKTWGSKLVTRSGKQVLLQGVNLGGWLIQEAWI